MISGGFLYNKIFVVFLPKCCARGSAAPAGRLASQLVCCPCGRKFVWRLAI